MLKRITAFLIAGVMLGASSASVSAAEIDAANVGAESGMNVVAAEYEEVGTQLAPAGELPSAYSSADAGWVTPVRRQQYNTCWAYGSTAMLESLLLKNRFPMRQLSTMHMNYWGTQKENGKGWQRGYSAAGYPYIALGYLTAFGSVTEERFPQQNTIDDYAADTGIYPYVSADSIVYLDSNDRDTIKTAIYEYGGAVGNFHYDDEYLSSNDTAYYCDLEGLATSQLNGHAVEVVGWNDSYSRYSFKDAHRPASDGAWLCKNSWGVSRGDNGYIWISYEDFYLFDSRFGPSYTVTGFTPMTAVHQIKQDELYGATYEFNYITGEKLKKLTFVNVFDFSDGYQKIDKVIFESTTTGQPYYIYYIPLDENDVPVTDESRWMLLAQGTVDYQGYISANAYGFRAPASKGAIGVQLYKNADGDSITIGVDEWLSSGSVKFFDPETDYGNSYIIGFQRQPMDLKEFYYTYMKEPGGSNEPDSTGGTFVIKALCRNNDTAGDVDRDGSFNIMDVTASQRIQIDLDTADTIQERFMDFDNDGYVEIADCTRMQRSLMNTEQESALRAHFA